MVKTDFYENYYSGHLLNYKGEININSIKEDARAYTKSFKEFLPKEKGIRILDLACGVGKIVFTLQQMGYHNVEGIEISDELVQLSTDLGIPGVKKGDIMDFLKEGTQEYDVIILKDIIEHFKLADTEALLKLCNKRLKKGGRIIIHCPNGESPFFGRVLYGDITHEMAFTTRSIAQLLVMVGFRRFSFYKDKRVLSLKRLHKMLLWAIVRFVYRILIYAESEKKPVVVTQNFYTLAYK